MKKWTLTMIAAAIAAGAATYSLSRPKLAPVASDAVPLVPPVPAHPVREESIPWVDRIQEPTGQSLDATDGAPASLASAEPKPEDARSRTLSKAVDLLVSNEVSQQERQAMWKHLQDGGELDAVIAELKKRATDSPNAAKYPLVLGQALLNKIADVKERNEQGILALQADQSLDAALRLEPTNWEAQFLKAASLARWPEGLNRGEEVIQRFTTLIEQQEKMHPEPQFARSYVLLGDQYQKSGDAVYALGLWKMGVALFPSDSDLQQRLGHAVAR